jgi:hypothetical protein
LSLGICGLLASIAFSTPAIPAQLGPFQIPFSFTVFDTCVSAVGGQNENILFTGILQVQATETETSSGAFHIDEVLALKNGKGTGQTSGTQYTLTQIIAVPQQSGPRLTFDTAGGAELSFELEANILNPKAPKILDAVVLFLRETVNPDGSITNVRLEPSGTACG